MDITTAILEGRHDEVNEIIEKYPNIKIEEIYRFPKLARRLIMLPNMLTFLLTKGILDINHYGIGGTTILMEATALNDLEMVKALISMGADVFEPNDRCETPLFVAVVKGHEEIAEVLIENGAEIDANVFNLTPMTESIAFRRLGCLKILVKYFSICVTDINEMTPLMLLADSEEHDQDMAEFIISEMKKIGKGTSPFLIRSDEQKTALDYAVENNNSALSEMIIEAMR